MEQTKNWWQVSALGVSIIFARPHIFFKLLWPNIEAVKKEDEEMWERKRFMVLI